MTAHDIPFLWCALQVALLSTLGLATAWLFARRAPAVGATAAAAAAAMIAVVTLLIPARVPKLDLWPPSDSGDLLDATALALGDHPEGAVPPQRGGPSFDVEDLAARMLSSVGAGGMAEREFGPLMETCFLRLFALGAVLGALRFLWALSFVARLRSKRSRIGDEETSRMFTEVMSGLGVSRAVELCESPRIGSPAVIGWRHPIVFLPSERSDWTEQQLRATLAHELAHVARGDFFWRFVAGAAQAMHFFHPLVHLLMRRLTLMQELATDRLAASAAGGPATYLRALSELALRLDDQTRLRAEPIVLPALSSNLMRRISMLRSMDGSDAAPSCRAASAIVIVILAVVGVGSMALRGNAEAIESELASSASESPLFARRPIDPSIVSGSEEGLFVVRLGELAQRPQFVPVVGLINSICREPWQALFGGPAPELNFDSVEFVAGVPQLKIRPMTDEQKAHAPDANGQLMIGCGQVIVRFKHDVDWRTWVRDYMLLAEEKTEDGFTYVELPAIEALGPVPLLMAARDSRTLVFAAGNASGLRMLAESADDGAVTVLAEEWARLDGGLATMLASDEHIDRTTPTPEAPQAQVILQSVKRVGVALDLDADSKQAGLRLDLICADAESAERVRDAFAELIPLAVATLEAEARNPTQLVLDETERAKVTQTAGDADTNRQVAEFWFRAVRSCQVQVAPNGNGAARVRLSATAPFPKSICTAYEYEVAEKPGDVSLPR